MVQAELVLIRCSRHDQRSFCFTVLLASARLRSPRPRRGRATATCFRLSLGCGVFRSDSRSLCAPLSPPLHFRLPTPDRSNRAGFPPFVTLHCTRAPSKQTIGRQTHARAQRGSIADTLRLEVFTILFERRLLQPVRLILVVPVVISRITTGLFTTMRGISASNRTQQNCQQNSGGSCGREPGLDLRPFLTGFTSF
jgi:hypothetical protein